MSDNWCTIESDPGVFTELISNFGVQDVQVDEIYSLDQSIEKSYGLIFLFKWRKETDDRPVIPPEYIPQLFFANQVISNACATQAILSVLLNAEEVSIGTKLQEFKQFALSLDSECKGLAISNSDMIRESHNSFARSEPFEMEDSKSHSGKGDAYHFIAFVPFQGSVYEIDGLKAGPIKLGEIDGVSWLDVARPAIESRMARYSQTETHFALLSLNPKRSTILEATLATLQRRIEMLQQVLHNNEGFGAVLEEGYMVGSDREAVSRQIDETNDSICNTREDLADEESKRERQHKENVRRKHNYLPFISKLIQVLAEKDVLSSLISAAEGGSSNGSGA